MGQPVRSDAAARLSPRHRRTSNWPFKSTQPEPSAVTEFGVGVPKRQEVEFADGSRLWLHRVEPAGVPDLFLRELGAPAMGAVVDLRQLAPDLAKDLPEASTRDVPGLVHFSLRGHFKSVDAFLAAAVVQGGPA